MANHQEGYLEEIQSTFDDLDQALADLRSAGLLQPDQQLVEICNFTVFRFEFSLESTPTIDLCYDLTEYPDGDIYAVSSARIFETSHLIPIDLSLNNRKSLEKFIESNHFKSSRSKIVEYLRRYEPATFKELTESNIVSNETQEDYLMPEFIEEAVEKEIKTVKGEISVETANKRTYAANSANYDELRSAYAKLVNTY